MYILCTHRQHIRHHVDYHCARHAALYGMECYIIHAMCTIGANVPHQGEVCSYELSNDHPMGVLYRVSKYSVVTLLEDAYSIDEKRMPARCAVL